jgi:hypothetical protein
MIKSSSRYEDLGKVVSKGWLDSVVTDLIVKLVRYCSDKRLRRLSCLRGWVLLYILVWYG